MTKFKTNLLGKGVKPGAKVQSSRNPQLYTDLGFNKLTLNAKAAKLMNLTDDDYIYLFDLGVEAQDGIRFVACKGFEANGTMQGAKLASTSKEVDTDVRLSFSYSPIWGAMLKNDPEVTDMSSFDLIKEGYMQEYTSTGGKAKSKRALKRAYFTVVPLLDEDGEHSELEVFEDVDGEIHTALCYGLTDASFKDIKPLEEGQEENDPEVDETQD